MDTIDRIFKIMEEKQLSAYAVSKNTGIANSTISDWKKGKGRPSADNIAALADYFNVSTDYLLGRTPYKRPTDDPDLVWGYGTLDRDLTPDELEQVKSYVEMMIKAHDSEKKDK